MVFSHKNPEEILLMEEILHHLGCIKPCKYWDKLFAISTGDRRISEPSTVWRESEWFGASTINPPWPDDISGQPRCVASWHLATWKTHLWGLAIFLACAPWMTENACGAFRKFAGKTTKKMQKMLLIKDYVFDVARWFWWRFFFNLKRL